MLLDCSDKAYIRHRNREMNEREWRVVGLAQDLQKMTQEALSFLLESFAVFLW